MVKNLTDSWNRSDKTISKLETEEIIENVAQKDKEKGNTIEKLRYIEDRMKSHKFLIRLP